MLQCIVQRFLGNPEEAEGNVAGELLWYVAVSEINVHGLLFGELLAEAAQSRNDAKIFQFRRVKLMGYGLQVVRDLAITVPYFHEALGGNLRARGRLLEFQRQHRQSLANIIMQLSRDSAAL